MRTAGVGIKRPHRALCLAWRRGWWGGRLPRGQPAAPGLRHRLGESGPDREMHQDWTGSKDQTSMWLQCAVHCAVPATVFWSLVWGRGCTGEQGRQVPKWQRAEKSSDTGKVPSTPSLMETWWEEALPCCGLAVWPEASLCPLRVSKRVWEALLRALFTLTPRESGVAGMIPFFECTCVFLSCFHVTLFLFSQRRPGF